MALERVSYGPTWKTDDEGAFVFPELSLGWEILEWAESRLRVPDTGDPWRFTAEQIRWIVWWYAVDKTGRFLYADGMLRRVKGWGKDPLAAVVSAVEFVGPCRFERFERGQPVAKPHPAGWVLIAAVSKDQTRTTMSLFPGLFTDETLEEHQIDVGKEIIYAHSGRARIEAVTSSPRALEGPRPTFTLKNETQHWLRNNDGHAMAATITRNAVKARDGAARRLALSNAHNPGEDSDAEHDWEAFQKMEQGRTRSRRFMYDSLEAPPALDLADEGQLRQGLRLAAGDSTWLDEDGHVETIYDPRNSVADSRRFYLNQLVAAEDAWIAPHEWDALAAPRELDPDEEITLGLDPSKTDDHTVLMGCAVSDGYVFTVGLWRPEDHGGEIPRGLVDEVVRSTIDVRNVVAFLSDLHPFESYVDRWAEDFGADLPTKASRKHAVAFDMRSKKKEMTVEYERLHDEIVEGRLTHDGDPRVRQHFANARRRPNAWGVSVGKEHRESARKIDAVPSTVLARMGRRLHTQATKRRRPKRSGRSIAV